MDDTFYLNDSNKGYLSIYDYDFLESLLKNDVKLYGRFISEIFIDKTSVYRYIKTMKRIEGWGFIEYKDIIDRDLYPYIISYNITSIDYSKYTRVHYKLLYNDLTIYISILYLNKSIKDFKKVDLETIKKYSGVCLDIDLLQMDRFGLRILWVPNIYKDSPNPFREICLNFKNKYFRVLSEPSVMEYIFIDDIILMITSGWIAKTKFIKKRTLGTWDSNDECSFCKKFKIKDFTDDIIITLPCNHQYHYTCWIGYIREKIKKKSLKSIEIKCCDDTCKKVVPNWELIC